MLLHFTNPNLKSNLHIIVSTHSVNNDFLVVNQFTVTENNQNKRPDIILFVNGIPLEIIEF
ncbi:MAG: hypothetical protein IPN22_12285 [Bacteroidetes bacterium]|nr:hypothetical protein [Bacteroidota bacterium]